MTGPAETGGVGVGVGVGDAAGVGVGSGDGVQPGNFYDPTRVFQAEAAVAE